VLEIHLLDFDHEIYGKDVEVRFVRYLRPEQKFENLDGIGQADRVRCAASTEALY
jgi:riboflavin kinase/FMN adenylyltransferase